MKPFALLGLFIIGLLATSLTAFADVKIGTLTVGDLAFENTVSSGASVTSISVTLPASTFFDSSSTAPGTQSQSFSVSYNVGSVGVVLPSNAATDGQRTANFSFTSFDPGDSVIISCDYDLYASPDTDGDPLGAVIVVTYSNGQVFSGSLDSLTRSLANGNWRPSASIQAPPTQRDITFSGDGIQITPFPNAADVRAVAVQPDGKAVVAGFASNGTNNDFALARYNVDGSLDAGFGTGGTLTTAIGSGEDIAYSLALQGDGKILVAGFAFNGSNNDFAVVRYHPDGTLDTTFNGSGKVTTPIGGSHEEAYRIAVQGDGKIVVAGRTAGSTMDFALVRYTTTGVLDSSFGTGGKVTTAIGSGFDAVSAMRLQTDGKIVVGGPAHNGTNFDAALARYQSNGTLDPTFGTAGKATFAIGSGDDQIDDFAIQPDGKIVATGPYGNGATTDCFAMRVTAAGSLDASFDGDGKTSYTFGSSNDYARTLTLQPDGKIVMAGYFNNGANNDMGVARVNSNGSLDTSFDGDGKVIVAPGAGDDELYGVTFDHSSGKIVAAGTSESAGARRFAVVRLIGSPLPGVWNLVGVQSNDLQSVQISGQVDPAGSSTTVTVEYGTSAALGNSFSLGTFTGNGLQAFNGAFSFGGGLVLGTTYHYRVTATNANGTTTGSIQSLVYAPGAGDFTFSGDGIQTTAFVNGVTLRASQAFAVTVQPDGKIVAAGEVDGGGQSNFALARYLPDGTLDASFGTGGQVTTALSAQDDYSRAVTVLPNGNILVAGTVTESGASDFALVRYLPNGTPDTSFGTAGLAKAAFNLGGSNNDVANAMAVQPDGKIVVAGYAFTASGTTDVALARFTASGGLDSSFDGDGKLVTVETGTNDSASAVAIQPDGKVVVAGRTPNAFFDFFVLRYNSNGSMDSGTGPDTTPGDSFGPANGRITVSIGDDDSANGIALQQDGKIVISGYTSNGTTYGFAALRFTGAGVLDPTFDGDGKVTTLFAAANSGLHAFGTSCVLQPDGRLVLAGMASNGTYDDMAVARYNPDGSLDATFDGDGKALLNPGPQSDRLHAVRLAATGNIVAAGFSQNASGVTQFAVVRLLGGPNDLLVNGGFEANESLGGGMPTGYGDWRNESAVSVTAQNGITPFEGGRMLAFVGTGINVFSTDDKSTVTQYVPMSSFATQIAAGTGCRVHVIGRFNRIASVPQEPSADSLFRIRLRAFNGTPASPGPVTVENSQSVVTDANLTTWESLVTFIDLPSGTTMVEVSLEAEENNSDELFPDAEFTGNYGDGFQLTVQTDLTAPTLSPVTIASNNANTAWAKAGDTVTLSFTANEPIQAPAVSLFGSAATVANAGGNNWTATATVGAGTAQGVAAFSIAAVDLIGNTAPPVTATTNARGVTVDKTAPTLNLPANLIVAATSPAGANVAFSATATDNLDPSPGVIATPASGSTFPLGITTVNASATDAAGNSASGGFTISVGNLVDGVIFTTPATVPLTDNGFTATGQSVGPMTLGFDPAPGQVLTLVNNTSANPIGGNFTNLPDGGTIATSYGGRDFLFVANYSGGDGNDLTLTLLNPEIAVEQPLLADIPDGGSKGFGTMVLGSPVSLVFTLKNTGPGILNGLMITKSGTDQAAFSVTASPTAPVAGPSGTTTFTVQFNPATSGAKTAAIHIASDDANENPFDIIVSGQALSVNDDTDTDGLNDAAEFLMSALGYDWQVSQPALVSALMTNANTAGLFTPAQVQALHFGTPLIQRNPATGQFKLTIGLEKSTNLSNFSLYPFTAPQTTVNGQGKIEFLFTSPDDAAFFRLEVE